MENIKLWDSVPAHDGGDAPYLTYYPAENKKGNGAVIIFPGGGYARRAPHEGKGYAEYLNANGINCFVLEYRVSPNRFPLPLLDARRAVRYVRANAEKFGIDPNKVAVMGSSAGGHLAAFVSTYTAPIDFEGCDAIDEQDFLPNAQILCYPVIDMLGHRGSFLNLLGENAENISENYTPTNLADENTPPMFLWHTSTDACVDINNSFRYAMRLHELKIPMEMHIYPLGGHGLGLAPSLPYIQDWAPHLVKWLKHMEYID